MVSHTMGKMMIWIGLDVHKDPLASAPRLSRLDAKAGINFDGFADARWGLFIRSASRDVRPSQYAPYRKRDKPDDAGC